MRREISEAKPMETKMHIGLDDVVKQSFERLQKGVIEKPEENWMLLRKSHLQS